MLVANTQNHGLLRAIRAQPCSWRLASSVIYCRTDIMVPYWFVSPAICFWRVSGETWGKWVRHESKVDVIYFQVALLRPKIVVLLFL